MGSITKFIPNLITAARFLLAAIFPFLLKAGLESPAGEAGLTAGMLVFTAICATDLIDGKLARKLNAVSSAGAVMDVTADLLYIVSAFIVLNLTGMVPVWFTAIIILKFVEFQVTSYIMKSCDRRISSAFIFDYFGRVSAILFYVIPGAAIILSGYTGLDTHRIINLILYITTLVTLVSFATRCMNCIRSMILKAAAAKM